jgi:hypothetical protein
MAGRADSQGQQPEAYHLGKGFSGSELNGVYP